MKRRQKKCSKFIRLSHLARPEQRKRARNTENGEETVRGQTRDWSARLARLHAALTLSLSTRVVGPPLSVALFLLRLRRHTAARGQARAGEPFTLRAAGAEHGQAM
jgi:hypothetical protein